MTDAADERELTPVFAYAVSVAGYILITLFTKQLVSWNRALLYFVVTLEVLPRLVRALRVRRAPTRSATPTEALRRESGATDR